MHYWIYIYIRASIRKGGQTSRAPWSMCDAPDPPIQVQIFPPQFQIHFSHLIWIWCFSNSYFIFKLYSFILFSNRVFILLFIYLFLFVFYLFSFFDCFIIYLLFKFFLFIRLFYYFYFFLFFKFLFLIFLLLFFFYYKKKAKGIVFQWI